MVAHLVESLMIPQLSRIFVFGVSVGYDLKTLDYPSLNAGVAAVLWLGIFGLVFIRVLICDITGA